MASEIERVRQNMKQSRMRYGHEIAKREHTLLAVAASALLGIAEAKGHKLPTVLDVDGTLVFGTIALIAADQVGGSGSRFLQSLADGWLSIGAYKMGHTVGGKPLAEGLGAVSDARAMDAFLSAT
jgi:hypothetical protein